MLPSPPLAHYDFLAETREASRRVVSRSFPQLMELVEDGTLVALERPPHYVERRGDGYQEPLVVILVGTFHMSSLSAAQVHRVVKAVQPQNVVVELCRSRAGFMNETNESLSKDRFGGAQSNLMSITGKSFGAALGRSLELGGQSAMALRLILGLVSEKLSSVAGVPSGEEFRAARRAAEEVGSQLVLGDRPIEITLRRAWEALEWLDRFKLTVVLLSGISSSHLDLSEETFQAFRSDSSLSAMFNYLSKEFPTLLQPLIHERDRYLAWSLTRSKAVNGSSLVVGVIGRGHMKGVVHALKHDRENLHFRDLVGFESSATKQKRGQVRRFIKKLAVDTVIGGILWLIYDHVCSDFNINSVISNLSFHITF